MKVKIVFEADDEMRKAIRHWFGQTGKATHEELRLWFQERGYSQNDDVIGEYKAAEEDLTDG